MYLNMRDTEPSVSQPMEVICNIYIYESDLSLAGKGAEQRAEGGIWKRESRPWTPGKDGNCNPEGAVTSVKGYPIERRRASLQKAISEHSKIQKCSNLNRNELQQRGVKGLT